jgi:hypothetical protein
MLRRVLGIAAGALLWYVAFNVMAYSLAMLWPDYAAQGRIYIQQGLFTFTSTMAVCNLILWVLAEVAAGWITMLITKQRQTVWVLAGLLVIALATVHLLLSWSRFPWWYNLGVVIPAGFAVLLGGRLYTGVHGRTA